MKRASEVSLRIQLDAPNGCNFLISGGKLRKALQKEGGVMRTPSKIITALALAGLAVAGGAAFTATGIIDGAPTTAYVGGAVSQSVAGAVTLSSIAYGFDDLDPVHAMVQSVKATFSADVPNSILPVLTTLPSTQTGGHFDTAVKTANATGEYTFTWVPDVVSGTLGLANLSNVTVTVPGSTSAS